MPAKTPGDLLDPSEYPAKLAATSSESNVEDRSNVFKFGSPSSIDHVVCRFGAIAEWWKHSLRGLLMTRRCSSCLHSGRNCREPGASLITCARALRHAFASTRTRSDRSTQESEELTTPGAATEAVGRVWLSMCTYRNIVRVNWLCLLAIPSGLAAQAASVCNPADLVGPYAFQLTGWTDISGSPKPTTSLGLIVFDGSGGLSGTASAMFRGLLLGNPVTGSYEAKADCSVIWKLQDDSGGFQNFGGTLSSDGTGVQFKQTDPGGAQRGIMKKTSDACSAADLQPKYHFTVSGSVIPMLPGEISRTVSASGTLDIGENGSFEVDSDCAVRFALTLPAQNAQGGEPPPMTMRGFLVEGGKEILAFQTDPGAMVAARLSSDSK